MDPNEALKEIRSAAWSLEAEREECGTFNEGDTATLVAHSLALDNWIRQGGALPDAWRLHGGARFNGGTE